MSAVDLEITCTVLDRAFLAIATIYAAVIRIVTHHSTDVPDHTLQNIALFICGGQYSPAFASSLRLVLVFHFWARPAVVKSHLATHVIHDGQIASIYKAAS